MKKLLFTSFMAILALGLAGCRENDLSSSLPSTTPEVSDKTGSDTGKSTTPEPVEDFTIKASDNGLSAAQSSYTFATLQKGDKFPPDAKIRLTTDDRWAVCSSLNERYTKFTAENPSVLPEGSVDWTIVTKDDLGIGNKSNEIVAIDLVFDRELIRPGESKLKFETRGYNGSTTVTGKTTTVCLDITIKEFGTIEVETYEVNLDLNLTGLKDIIEETETDATDISWTITDSTPEEEVYGYSADYSRSVAIELSDTQVKIEGMKFAVGHSYNTWIFIEGEVRVWIALEADGSSSDYELTPNKDNSQSALTVEKDGVSVKAKLGDYYSLDMR